MVPTVVAARVALAAADMVVECMRCSCFDASMFKEGKLGGEISDPTTFFRDRDVNSRAPASQLPTSLRLPPPNHILAPFSTARLTIELQIWYRKVLTSNTAHADPFQAAQNSAGIQTLLDVRIHRIVPSADC